MPDARGKKLSTESLDALILALGLSEPDNAQAGGDVESQDTDETIRATRTVSNRGRKSSLAVFSGPTLASVTSGERPLDMDAAETFARDYLSDYDICSDFEENCSYGDSDLVPSRPESFLETFEMVGPYIADTHTITQTAPLSPTSTHLSDDTIYLKVAYNAAIIMLRVPRFISFMDLKRRLYDKFVNQQKNFLSHTFSVLLALPPDSLPSPGYKRVSFASRTEMRPITRESDWRNIVSVNDGSKITLRILNTPP